MSAKKRAYLDTSALAKWDLNEAGSEAFVEFLQGLDSAVISSLSVTEMRSLLSRRRSMGDIRLNSSICCLQPFSTISIVAGCSGIRWMMHVLRKQRI